MERDSDPRHSIKSIPIYFTLRFPADLTKAEKVKIEKWIMNILNEDFKKMGMKLKIPEFPDLVKIEKKGSELVYKFFVKGRAAQQENILWEMFELGRKLEEEIDFNLEINEHAERDTYNYVDGKVETKEPFRDGFLIAAYSFSSK